MSERAVATDLASTKPSSSRPLGLVVTLTRDLAEAGIRYCHWKSNVAIDRSATGENDLDLLVLRSDLTRFTELLSRLGFVRTARSVRSIPGIESFYGYDAEADCLVHVHAHYQLVLGDDRTKNYRLPIEEAYVASSTQSELFALPAPEMEYVVLVVRMILKYCTWDEIAWRAARGRRAEPSRSERNELDHLSGLIDDTRVERVLEEHLPFLDPRLFADCVAALGSGASLPSRLGAGRRLEQVLQPHARYSRRTDRALRIRGRIAQAASRRMRRRDGKERLVGGGALVGIMGGDGSGKSTALAALGRWLEPELDVRVVHLGKPRWSATTVGVRGGLKVALAATDGLQRVVRVGPARRAANALAMYRPLFWLLCTARDRRRAYRRARRLANEGCLVLCDRYPHPRLRSMEAPLIAARTADGPDNRVVRAMIALEERYHRSIAPPEVLAVLRLDPEIAVRRKTEEKPESVRARGAEVWEIDWRGSRAHVVDASRPEDEVARELKSLVWSALA